MAGYSGKPLVEKLGIKSGMRLLIVDAPDGYDQTLGELPVGVETQADFSRDLDFIQFFTTERVVFEARFPELRDCLQRAGILWISWPKKAAKIPTDLNENIIREFGLANGMVDVKVCAVDERWSGLKFVFRLKDR